MCPSFVIILKNNTNIKNNTRAYFVLYSTQEWIERQEIGLYSCNGYVRGALLHGACATVRKSKYTLRQTYVYVVRTQPYTCYTQSYAWVRQFHTP